MVGLVRIELTTSAISGLDGEDLRVDEVGNHGSDLRFLRLFAAAQNHP